MTDRSRRRALSAARNAVLGVVAGLSLAALAACSPGAARKDAAAPAGKGGVAIRFATDWRAEAEHGGFYEALALGEYRKRGLDVTILQGGPGSNVPELLAAGQADMGIGSNSFGVLNLAAEGVPVKAVMAVFQKDPQVLIAHDDPTIASLADLKGHPILLADAAITSFWPWLKAKYGLKDAQVRKYSFSAAPFLADKRAVQEGYVTSEPYTIEKEGGFKPRVFLLADNGYPGYAAMVLAPDKLIASDPKTVRAFVEATAEGWRQYLHGDPRPADALILKANPEMKQDVLDQARAKMRDYGIVESGDAARGGIGVMTDAGWRRFGDTARSVGLAKPGLDLRRAYTLQFVSASR